MKTGKTKNRRSFLKRLTLSQKKQTSERQSTTSVWKVLHELFRRGKLKSKEIEEQEANLKVKIQSRNSLESFAFEHFSRHLPSVSRYRESYEQAGMAVIFESYMSTAIFLSLISAALAIAFSTIITLFFLHFAPLAILGTTLLFGASTAGFSILVWMGYPLQRRRAFRAKLENQIAYSFGILGVLSAAGISVERMFERMASSDPNPVLASLARRFIRNIKIFGLDTDSALREVAKHSPSRSFAKMLESIAIAFKTTGSVNDLILFESGRLLAEKSDKLKKKIGDLAVMAELYITLIVVGPIIFIVMLSILQLLPYSGSLPSIPLINALVFVGIPVVSIGFTVMLDSLTSKI